MNEATFDRFTPLLTLAGIVLLVAYLFARKTAEVLQKGGDAVAEPIANALTPILVGGSVEVLGNVLLPNGNRVPLSRVQVKGDGSFDHQGVRYVILKRINGDYEAIEGTREEFFTLDQGNS